jgi:hypothetical protein
LKHFRKTIAATMTAIAVAGVTMASAPPASAGDPLPLPEPEFMHQVDPLTTWGGLTNGDPFIGRSLDPESIDAIDNFRENGDWPLTTACWDLTRRQDAERTCIDVVLAAIRREQPLYWGQRPFWMRVGFSQYGYVTYLLYPSGYMTSYRYYW